MKFAILAATALLLSSAFALADVVTVGVGAGAAPGNFDPKICVYDRTLIVSPDNLGQDAPTINVLELRTSNYLFTGEQIEYLVVVRDYNGALDIGHAFIQLNGSAEVVCNPDDLPSSCDGLTPPTGSGLSNGETDSDYDKAFHCLYTAE
ncbi:MAG: hypothetical protein HY519_01495, partial [Candidatus Aenigmarchaeota archaeon]|nr:hypothetical protein [Candidatus Aenigmarchaeota archaeon]